MTQTIVVSFRTTPWKLAKMLDGVRKFDPAFEIKGINPIVKRCLDMGIAATTSNLDPEPSRESLDIVLSLSRQVKKRAEKKENTITQEQMIEFLANNSPGQPKRKMTIEEAMAEGERLQQEMIRKSMSNKKLDPRINDIDLGSQKNNVEDFRPMTVEEISNLSE